MLTTAAAGSRSGLEAAAAELRTAPDGYAFGIGYLRAFIIVLVVAHHALFAYNPAPPPPGGSLLEVPRSWRAFPVVDDMRSGAALVFNSFTDTFFMSLMFLISGLFVWGSLERKGTRAFLRDRALRLGIPFIVAALLIAPIAFYPAYLTMAARPSAGEYARQWLALREWPAGPAWFIWVLLAFNAAAALAYLAAPSSARVLARAADGVLTRPAMCGAVLVALSAAVYVPAAVAAGPAEWTTFGPFAVQTSRVLHYAVYFAAGIVVGAHGLGRGILASGRMDTRWPLWVAAAGAAFAVFVLVHGGVAPADRTDVWRARIAVMFAVSCGASSLAFLAVFLRFADRPRRVLDSLRDNAYGIYLIHFPFTNWIQYLLLDVSIPVAAKASVVFVGTLLASWVTAALLRRVPAVRRLV